MMNTLHGFLEVETMEVREAQGTSKLHECPGSIISMGGAIFEEPEHFLGVLDSTAHAYY